MKKALGAILEFYNKEQGPRHKTLLVSVINHHNLNTSSLVSKFNKIGVGSLASLLSSNFIKTTINCFKKNAYHITKLNTEPSS